MRNIILSLLMGMFLISLVNATTETYNQNQATNLQFICTINGAIPTAPTMNISLFDPKGRVVLDNVATTSQGLGAFNYTFTFTQTGTYKVKMFCWDGTESYSDDGYYEIVGVGNTSNKGVTETSIFMLIALVISILVFLKVSKFFGSMLIFVLGFAILFINPTQGYIGWIIIGAGFLMIMYALLKPQKSQGRQIRW